MRKSGHLHRPAAMAARFDAELEAISGNTFPNAIIIDANTNWGASYGIRNARPLNAFIRGTTNKLCNNNTHISDTAVNSVYINNTLTTGPCL